MSNNESFPKVFLNHADTSPEQIAFIHVTENGQDLSITYKELIEKSLSVAEFIKSETHEGDTVILCFPSGIDFIISFLGCMFAGVIAVPCMPPINQESAKRMNLIIKSSRATLALANHKILSSFKKLKLIHLLDNALTKPIHSLLSSLHHDIKIESENRWIALEDISDQKVKPFFSNRFDEPLFLQYTSGSTAAPKGVKISIKNLLVNFQMIVQTMKWKGEFINCHTWLPLYHDMGLIGTVLFPLYMKGQTAVMSPLDFLKSPLKWLEVMSRHKSNLTATPQFAIELILKKIKEGGGNEFDLSNLRWLFNGAEPIRYDSIMRFIKLLNLNEAVMLPVYGLAESTLLVSGYREFEKINSLKISKNDYSEGKISITNSEEESFEVVSCGKVFPNTRLEIVDVNSSIPLSEDEVGEICLSNGSVSSGYWENEEETEKTFFINRQNKKIPMLRTGDLGFVHKSELYISGRKKDLIIINGRNYYPQDIEKVIEEAHDNIRTGCSAAFSVIGEISEELVVVAEVKVKPSHQEFEAIRSHIIRHFQLIPKDIKLIAPRSILKTTSGKIRRRDMRQRYLENSLNLM